MSHTDLRSTVHRLTRDHKTTHVDSETGHVTYPTELALFTQLRQEQASGSRAATGAKSSGRAPPSPSAQSPSGPKSAKPSIPCTSP